MLRNIGKQSRESQGRVNPEKRKGSLRWQNLQKKKVLSLGWKSEGVMDDESGESMKLTGEVGLPLKELSESELERLVRDWRREAGS